MLRGRVGLALVLVCFGSGALLLSCLWLAELRAPAGSLSICYAGLTNSGPGTTLVQFRAKSTFRRRIRVGVGVVQDQQGSRWPIGVQVTNAWLTLAPGSQQTLRVQPPSDPEGIWRIVVLYQEDAPFLRALRDRLNTIAYYIYHWRPGRSTPIRITPRGIAWLQGPPMMGLMPRATGTSDLWL